MKLLLADVELLNRTTGDFVPAKLYQGADQANADSWRMEWKPLFDDRVNDLSSADERAALNAEDAHWSWQDVIAKTEKLKLAFEIYAIEADGKTQGLMLVRKAGLSRDPGTLNAPLIYVELLSTAPWNRSRLVENPLYRGVGELFMLTAVKLSLEEGFNGLVGLHSLPNSEGFYRDSLKMKDLGADAAKHMRYFEMTSLRARTFVDGS